MYYTKAYLCRAHHLQTKSARQSNVYNTKCRPLLQLIKLINALKHYENDMTVAAKCHSYVKENTVYISKFQEGNHLHYSHNFNLA